MPNVRFANSFLDYSIDGGNSSAAIAGFELSNLKNIEKPALHARIDQITDSRVVFDLLENKTSVITQLEDVNFTSCKYQESDSASGSWADITSTLTVEKDSVQNIYRRKDDLTLTSKRYLSLFIPAQTPADGAAYFRIGAFAIPDNATELNYQTRMIQPFSKTLEDISITDGLGRKAKTRRIEPMIIRASFAATVEKFFEAQRIREFVNLVRNTTDTMWFDLNMLNSWEAYLCKREGEFRADADAVQNQQLDFGTQVLRVNY